MINENTQKITKVASLYINGEKKKIHMYMHIPLYRQYHLKIILPIHMILLCDVKF